MKRKSEKTQTEYEMETNSELHRYIDYDILIQTCKRARGESERERT